MVEGCSNTEASRKVVIVGGGYAGTTCAVTLARGLVDSDDIEIVLIEPNPCQQALSELDLVSVGPPRPEFCELWHPKVFRNLPVTVCYNSVAEIRPDEHAVVTATGGMLTYWRLIIATGCIAWMPPIPGLAERAITMWSVADAQRLQHAIEGRFRLAARQPLHEERRTSLSFVVVGGGATGVEILGTLAQMLPKRIRHFGLDPIDLRCTLIEARKSILPSLPAALRATALRRLGKLGVEVITGDPLDHVDEHTAVLGSGRVVEASVLVWAGGVRADPHAREWGLEVRPSGRLVIDQTLRTPSNPDIYVIGDVSAGLYPKSGAELPQLAQIAIQEGPHAATSVLAEARGQEPRPFQPHLRGEFVSIGPSYGVGWMYGVRLRGLAAITMKRITYVKYWLQVGGIGLAWTRALEMFRMGR